MQRLWRGALLTIAIFAFGSVQAFAQKDISEDTVKSFMNYAWSLTPSKFTKPGGGVVEIDKKARDKVEVPIDSAREIIRAGRLTAHAQLCELAEDQVLNYRSLMKREDAKKTWTEQQMIYINQLHLTTVMLLTGKIKLIEQQDGAKQTVVEVEDTRAADAKSCTDEQRKKVKELITAYLKSGPPVSLDSSVATQAAPPAAPPPALAPAATVKPAAAPTATKPAAATPGAVPAKKP